ncbi:MAG: hypothetical protein HRU09_06500 [Oligoflexales bacterium]|nr:hypothetical protein [Oligoflexales bacterium]
MGNIKKPLLHHGANPINRRDAIARGFMMGGSIAVVPSVFTEILAQKAFGAECAAVDAAANDRIPFMTFHFEGGINFLNTGLALRGDGANGNADAIAGGGYTDNGMPDSSEASRTLLGGIKTYTGSAFFNAFNDTCAAAGVDPTVLASSTAHISLCADTNDDTSNLNFGNLPREVIEGIPALNLPGVPTPTNFVSQLFGSSGAGGLYNTSVATNVVVDQIESNDAARALLDSSAAGAAFGGLANLTNALKAGQDVSALRFAQHQLDPNVANNLECAYQESNRILANNTPDNIDYTIDPAFAGLEAIATGQGANQGEVRTAFAHAKAVLDGYAITSEQNLSGFDNHGGGGNNADRQYNDAVAGYSLITCIAIAAARKGRPIIFSLITDGSQNGNGGASSVADRNATTSDSAANGSCHQLCFGTVDLAAGTLVQAMQVKGNDPMGAQYGVITSAGVASAGNSGMNIGDSASIAQFMAMEILGANGIGDAGFLMPFTTA